MQENTDQKKYRHYLRRDSVWKNDIKVSQQPRGFQHFLKYNKVVWKILDFNNFCNLWTIKQGGLDKLLREY